MTGALAKLTRVNNTPSNVFVPAFNRGFGLHAGLADFAAISIFAAYHMNIPAVLTNAPTINPFGGPPPTLPATVFKCGLNDAADGRPAQSVGDGIVVLYPRFFTLPLSGLWPTDTQIGTILHESVHVIGGPMDLAFNGNEANVQAEMLAGANDSRTLTNAYNYEFFYMGPEFF